MGVPGVYCITVYGLEEYENRMIQCIVLSAFISYACCIFCLWLEFMYIYFFLVCIHEGFC